LHIKKALASMVYSLIDYSLMSSTRVTTLAGRRRAIRRIFIVLRRNAEYLLSDVSHFTGMPRHQIRKRIKSGEIAARQQRGVHFIRWPEIATLAMQRWSIAVIEGELGERASELLPPLLLTRNITLTLPSYQIEMLHRIARRKGMAIDAFLADHLLDLAATVADEMEPSVPGFIEAMRFPDA
jgi:hypothetical protein